MKKKPGFTLRKLCGENIIVAEGKENIDFSKIISMNESAAFLWESIADNEFDADTLATLLVDEYDIDHDTAMQDATMLTNQWLEAEIIK